VIQVVVSRVRTTFGGGRRVSLNRRAEDGRVVGVTVLGIGGSICLVTDRI